jgi:hypothetical protein
MNRVHFADVAFIAILSGVGTWFGGWWTLPVVGAVWQLVRGAPPSWLAGLGAGLAWLVLLAREPWLPLGRLADRVSGVFHLPPGGALLLALGYAWLLAWSAARLVRTLRVR